MTDPESSGAPAAAPRGEAPVVLITGCSSGIGQAVARRFASRGWRVYASMRRPDTAKGESLRDEARARGWTLGTPRLDVDDDASVGGAVAALLAETGGRLDVVICNAGYMVIGPLEETTPDELRAQFETNVVGVHRTARAVLPAMRARGEGRVVILGSLSGLVALPVLGSYHASKWAIEALAETLRYEVGPLGIDVALVEPGTFKTALQDNERLAAGAGQPSSPYAGLVAAYRREAKKMPYADLPALVDVIERAATVRHPRLRWPVGPRKVSVYYLRRIVPDFIYEILIRLVFWRRAR